MEILVELFDDVFLDVLVCTQVRQGVVEFAEESLTPFVPLATMPEVAICFMLATQQTIRRYAFSLC